MTWLGEVADELAILRLAFLQEVVFVEKLLDSEARLVEEVVECRRRRESEPPKGHDEMA